MSGARSSFLDRLPSIVGIIVLALVIAMIIVAGHNRGLQEQVNAGQVRIANAQTAGNLNNSLIRMLVTAAAEHDDTDIKALLTANGISYRPNGAATSTAKPDISDANAKEAGK